MAGFDPDEETAREHDQDLSPIPRDLEVYARIEGSVGEEDELLEQAEESPRGGAREPLRRSRRSSIAPGRRCPGAANDGAKPS